MSKKYTDGFAGRRIIVNQSRLDAGFVTVEVSGARGEHVGAIMLTPKGAAELSQLLENAAQTALAAGLLAELAVKQ